MTSRIKISEASKEAMRLRIVDYFSKERDEDMGILASQLVLDFFLEELAPYAYNQGIEDANVYIRDKLDDLFSLHIVV